MDPHLGGTAVETPSLPPPPPPPPLPPVPAAQPTPPGAAPSRWSGTTLVVSISLAVVIICIGITVRAVTASSEPVVLARDPDAPTSWERHLARADGMQIKWSMPETTGIDGPRGLRYISAPSIVTFWISLPMDDDLRYDSTLFQDVDHVSTDPSEVVVEVIDRLNGDTPIEFGTVTESDGLAEVDFEEESNDRIYLGHAFAWDGNVFSVTAAYPPDREDLRDRAEEELDAMEASFSREPL